MFVGGRSVETATGGRDRMAIEEAELGHRMGAVGDRA